jgi:hypothetical protein
VHRQVRVQVQALETERGVNCLFLPCVFETNAIAVCLIVGEIFLVECPVFDLAEIEIVPVRVSVSQIAQFVPVPVPVPVQGPVPVPVQGPVPVQVPVSVIQPLSLADPLCVLGIELEKEHLWEGDPQAGALGESAVVCDFQIVTPVVWCQYGVEWQTPNRNYA